MLRCSAQDKSSGKAMVTRHLPLLHSRAAVPALNILLSPALNSRCHALLTGMAQDRAVPNGSSWPTPPERDCQRLRALTMFPASVRCQGCKGSTGTQAMLPGRPAFARSCELSRQTPTESEQQ
eukprot:1302817-Amphidinium_carterae.2